MTTTPDYARLIERLEKVEPDTPGEGVTRYYRNPDGPGAAAAFRALLERYEALERERDELKHDVSRYVEIASDEATRAEAAEAKLALLRERLAEADRVIEPFAEYLDDGFDLDYEGRPLPDSNTLGWVYLTLGHLRDARSYRDKGRE